MKFKIKGDPRPYSTSSYEGLLHYLNATIQVQSKNIDDFMTDYAERAMKFKNIEIKSTDVESIVEDLIKIGEIERID
jgi:hypothetical protein